MGEEGRGRCSSSPLVQDRCNERERKGGRDGVYMCRKYVEEGSGALRCRFVFVEYLTCHAVSGLV